MVTARSYRLLEIRRNYLMLMDLHRCNGVWLGMCISSAKTKREGSNCASRWVMRSSGHVLSMVTVSFTPSLQMSNIQPGCLDWADTAIMIPAYKESQNCMSLSDIVLVDSLRNFLPTTPQPSSFQHINSGEWWLHVTRWRLWMLTACISNYACPGCSVNDHVHDAQDAMIVGTSIHVWIALEV